MLKFNLVLALLFLNVSAYATDYYVNSTSNFPEPLVITKVYMGDKMLQQRFEYSEQCYNPKKTFALRKQVGTENTVCYTSTMQIEKECCSGYWTIVVEKGGTMCGDDSNLLPVDFDSTYRHSDGNPGDNVSFALKRKRGNVTLSTKGSREKMIKLTEAEFENTFTSAESYWNATLLFEEGVPICSYSENSQVFYNVNASVTSTLPIESLPVSYVSVISTSRGVIINAKYVISTANHRELNYSSSDFLDHRSGSSTWTLSEEEFNNSFEETSKVTVVPSSMQRTIEYAGINGNLVKFIYSEFNDGMARDAFTREFSIDLSADNVAAYKGAVFEVIKATNSTIEYKVIRHFPVET